MVSKLALHLSHLILSHHGQKEWGAVEEPHTLEVVACIMLIRCSAREPSKPADQAAQRQ